MGEVYEAVDEKLGRSVALKRIVGHRQGDGEARARFWREARSLAAVRHAGLVTVYEIGEDEACGLFIAMELVDGVPLSWLFEAGALPLRLALELVAGAAEALGAAHTAELTHRDVKPGNLIVEPGGRVRVVDFGLARRMGSSDDELTREGAVLGTPSWMAPEQLTGVAASIGPPTDVFALGLVLWRALTGIHPFSRETPQATALAIAGGLRLPLGQVAPELPAGVIQVVETALASSPRERFANGAAMGRALERELAVLGPSRGELATLLVRAGGAPRSLVPSSLRATQPRAKERTKRWSVALAAVAAAVGVAWVASRGAADTKNEKDEPATGGLAGGVNARPSGVGPAAGAQGRVETWQAVDVVGTMNPVIELPPRPVVLVLGFEASDAMRADAEVTAEVARVRLAELAGLTSVSMEVADSLIPDVTGGTLTLAATRFARADRGLGHVDFVLRGRIEQGDAGALRAVMRIEDTRSGRVVATVEVVAVGDASAPIELAESLVNEVGLRLGLARGRGPRLSGKPESWTALMSARRALRGADIDKAREHLAWALKLDPGFSLAKYEELALFRMEGRHEELMRQGEALLAEPEGLPENRRAMVRALVAIVRGESETALRILDDLALRFPYELDAQMQLMSLRAKDPILRDVDELERIARRVLEVAPRHETAASRLVRALGIRGRASEAGELYVRLGIQRDDPELADVWAEIDLFSGDFDEAAAGFRAVLVTEPGNVYAEHMAIASDLLAGRCDEAAQAAMERIERITRLGHDSILDWTYSLSAQALMCAEAWDGLKGLLERWSTHGRSGFVQSLLLSERAALVQADAAGRAELAQRWKGMLESDETPAEIQQALVVLYSRVVTDVSMVEMFENQAKKAAMAIASTSPERLSARYLERALTARRLLLENRPADEVKAAYASTVMAWSEVEGEGEATGLIEALGRRAEAMEVLGDVAAARADWEAIAGAGYARLWVNDVWVMARQRLKPSGAKGD
jgi:serine/threonine-protein kinase